MMQHTATFTANPDVPISVQQQKVLVDTFHFRLFGKQSTDTHVHVSSPVWPSWWTVGPLEVGGSKRSTLVFSSLHMSAPTRRAAAEPLTALGLSKSRATVQNNFIKPELQPLRCWFTSRGACCSRMASSHRILPGYASKQ